MTLRQRAVKGLMWVTISTVIVRLVDFLTKLILARLLVPEDFGLVAIGFLIISTLALFSDLGVGAALIHRKEDIERAANTAFLIIPGVGVALSIFGFLSAPLVAAFYNNDVLNPIVKLFALSFLFNSFGVVPLKLMEKQMRFKRIFVPEAVSIIMQAFVAITLALNGFGVWALVYGVLIGYISKVILIWAISPWRPKLEFDKAIAKQLLGYGKYIMGASVIAFLITHGDDALVGKVLSMSALGFYTMAYTISNLPATQITHLVIKITFPLFSEVQNDVVRLRKAYLLALEFVSLIAIPIAFGIFILASDFVRIILGEKWMAMVPALRVLCLFGVLRSILGTTGSLFNGSGKPKILLNIQIVQLIILATAIYPLTKMFGIVGTGMAVCIAPIVQSPWIFYKVACIIDEKISNIIKILFIPIIASLVMGVFLYLVKSYLILQNGFLYLFVLILLGMIVYLGIVLLLNKNIAKEIKEIVAGTLECFSKK